MYDAQVQVEIAYIIPADLTFKLHIESSDVKIGGDDDVLPSMIWVRVAVLQGEDFVL